ncbi:hypothetical protein C6B36_09375 [Helicobacter cinaedi]|uniref:hypothetical protein n=1 Tax=Helicobacter cinaedi TaxID=213 RepID=UPI000CF10C4F|nr:hypothetical protein [Helicobacter cinaedi]AWK62522.1 hypothetical protein C6B36_09375 [Helicobacter cinaedi]QOQ96841.1 hypothetical protein HW245_04120 [Helicobacter cinaedi]
MKKTIFGLMISTMCAFGLEMKEALEAFTNGMMMGVCGASEEVAIALRLQNGMNKEKATNSSIERLKICGELTFKKESIAKSKSKNRKWNALYEEGIEVGKEAFGDSIEKLARQSKE